LKDYSGEKVNRETRIEGKCLTQNCENNFDKTFIQLYKINGYCKKCTANIRNKKYKATCLEKYGVDNPFQSQEFKDKYKATCLKKFGVDNPFQSQEFKDKYKATCLKNFGVENAMQSQEVREKCKATCLKKFGVEYALQSNAIKQQKIATCLKNFGVENPFQSQEIKEKSKTICLEKYSVEYPSQSQEVKDIMKATCLKNYGVEYASQSNAIKQQKIATCLKNVGVEYPLQSQEVKEKIKATYLEKYGVEHPQQNPEIAEKMSKASYSRKDYTFPSGKIIQVQGYEPFALNELVKTINEDEINTGATNVPEIWYDDDEGLKHRHHVDIFIPSQNRCIEVKSTWTAVKKKDNIFKKQQAGKELGYNYEIWIYNSKGEKVECFV
jgi:hypothetical protein